ncbi:type I polyketide synthase [Streptomyces sp. E2N166]|uniref:type I polyketide synthase n=1 Tax=Streptomyces sp. E2N166 TaxID=1851909 RepID=UPI000EF6B4D4|nr:type I polyketide synthase [Streptomyces sp. E2N166]
MTDPASGIAVIGMSCRFPGVSGPGEFWRLLLDGRSTVGTFPEQRAAGTPSPAHPDTGTLRAGSFFDAIDGFDAEFFGLDAAEAAAMDPVQRLGLELAWEAVEDARVPAGALAGREIDVVVGSVPSGYDLLRRSAGSDRDDHHAALGSAGALIANRISSLFDVRGMSYCADSGQSSSLVALALSCDRIRSGAVDTALAGGVELIADPESGLGLANMGALSPDGRCFSFDARAGGFVRGEGGAFVLLKRLDLAVADGDHIYAVVRGWSIGSAGATARMPDPSPGAQAATVLSALARADVPFDSVDYVEAHGTGTRLGDPAEASGLREVFRATGRSRPLTIGSVKTNVGHLEPAAGIAGFVKAALCVDRGLLVPSLNFASPNPAIADFHRDFEVPVTARPWPGPPGRPRRAGVSAFGMGGTNAHVVLEQAPRTPAARAADIEPGPHASQVLPWALSARSEAALREQALRLRELVAADASLTTADVGHSLLTTRTTFEHRAVLLGGDRDEALAGLDRLAAGSGTERTVRGSVQGPPGPIVFVFPGQGSQWLGMGRRLYAESAEFAHAIDACARALEPWVDWSLVDVVTAAEPAATLDRVDVVQPALFAMMVSLARVWRSFGVVPDAVVGHSQGEIAAACVAGALSLQDAARLVALRSRELTELAGTGGMSAVSASPAWVGERLRQWPGRLSTAAVNGPVSVVVSGDDAALELFAARAAEDDVRVRRVKVDYASHSHHVERIRERLLTAASDLEPRPPEVEFWSTVTGGPLGTRPLDGAYWYDNLRSTVRFGEVVERLMRAGTGVFVEVSPHPVLEVAMAETADALAVSPTVVGSLHKEDGSRADLLASLAELHVRGAPVDFTGLFAPHRPRRVALPAYAFQRRRYWLTPPDEPGHAPDAGGATGPGTALPDSEPAALGLVCAEASAAWGAKGPRPTAGDLAARPDSTFKDLGFESSTAVRLRNRLTAVTGVRLAATVAFSHPTPRRLARHLLSLLAPPAATRPAEPEKTSQEDRSDDELYALIERGYV